MSYTCASRSPSASSAVSASSAAAAPVASVSRCCRGGRCGAILLVLSLAVAATAQAQQPLIELTLQNDSVQGRVVARGNGWCVLYDRLGRMVVVENDTVSRFRRISPTFQPLSVREASDALLREFGNGYEVATTRHYAVCAPRDRAREYADLLEDTWRQFHMYFSVRGFEVDDPEFPMLAVVLPDRNSFEEYASREKAQIGRGILGYYWSTHNRIIMYEDNGAAGGQPVVVPPPGIRSSSLERQRIAALMALRLHDLDEAAGLDLTGNAEVFGPQDDVSQYRHDGQAGESLAEEELAWSWFHEEPESGLPLPATEFTPPLAARSGVDANLRETMIHEAIHQLGYNLGLHNRTGSNPKWVVEGLATVFEGSGLTTSTGGRATAGRRANSGWLNVFREITANGREEGYLEAFIQDDSAFQTDIRRAYAESWALSFWLVETRPRKYGEFLKAMSASEVSQQLTPQKRVQIFKDVFGHNLKMLEIEMLRFYQRL